MKTKVTITELPNEEQIDEFINHLDTPEGLDGFSFDNGFKEGVMYIIGLLKEGGE